MYIICLHLDDVIIPWESTNGTNFVAQIFLDSRLQYESLEDLMDFLAFLVQKLWQNKQKLIREIPENYSASSWINWGLLAITSAPETLGGRSRALKQGFPTFFAARTSLSEHS